MSGYPYGGNPPQYPPPQNQIYPQISNPANAPPPGQPSQPPHGGYAMPGQNPQYPFQPGFAYYPGQPGQVQQGYPGQAAQGYPGQIPQGYPGQPAHPASMSYPGIAPTAPQPNPGYNPGFPSVAPTQPAVATVDWTPSSPQHAQTLTDRAIVAGYEGHDGSPLWIIRAWFENDLIPGKLAIKHRSAYVAWGGKENHVQTFEVLCARPDIVRWVESRDGVIPPKAIAAGHTSSREPLYIGRAKHQGSLTPGKVHPSHKVLYISFSGQEVPMKLYEVLCAV